MQTSDKQLTLSFLFRKVWDFCCIATVVGIWPRFVEPNLLQITDISIPIPLLSPSLRGLKIVQISDLHFQRGFSDAFGKKLQRKVNALSPDILVFTGDFICYGRLEEKRRLEKLLQGFSAKHGCYAILGNHDYSAYIGVNSDGKYGMIPEIGSEILKGLARLIKKREVSGKYDASLNQLNPNPSLTSILSNTPFTLLENMTLQISVGEAKLNLTGLGEYMADRCRPDLAFKGYDKKAPGVVLLHNPDGLKLLRDCPGDLILAGHVHGGQVNLPWINGRFIVMENPSYARGLYTFGSRRVYVNRGIAGTLPFRLFSIPEITQIRLTHEPG